LPYNALIDAPEPAIRSMLDFVGEPFCARCLEPLSCQINSSDVPPDFVAEAPAADRRIVEEATNLYAELQNAPPVTELSSVAAEEMAAEFGRRVQHVATVEDQLRNAVQTVKTLEKQRLKENIRDEALL
jgi:hypothetical protein